MTSQSSWPEPQPDWDVAINTLGWLWPCHVYLFASLFTVLALVSTVALFLIHFLREARVLSNIMLTAVLVLAVTRAVTLLIDPYLSNELSTSLYWTVFCVMVSGLGVSCLTASLATLLYITAISTNITHHRVHLGRTTAAITACSFVFLITSDLLVAFVPETKVVLTICQTTFAAWGLLVALGFAILIWRIRGNAQASYEQASFNLKLQQESEKLRRLGLFLGILSFSGTSFFALRIYEALSYEEFTFSDTWTWWSLQTAMRSLEIIISVVLLLVFKKWKWKSLVVRNEQADQQTLDPQYHAPAAETHTTNGMST